LWFLEKSGRVEDHVPTAAEFGYRGKTLRLLAPQPICLLRAVSNLIELIENLVPGGHP
jgi:hypothetical protein